MERHEPITIRKCSLQAHFTAFLLCYVLCFIYAHGMAWLYVPLDCCIVTCVDKLFHTFHYILIFYIISNYLIF